MTTPPRFGPRRLIAPCICALVLVFASAAAANAQGLIPRLLGEPVLPKFEHLSRLGRMVVPVVGVSPQSLRDSFREGRSAGRTHEAIDIPAPRGTPVVAVADGVVVGLRHGGIGGNAIHMVDSTRKRHYFYAHLERFADRLKEGETIQQGDVIGYVGDTGNAGKGNYHLHFAVTALGDLRRWWVGETLNPYDLLQDALPARTSLIDRAD
jgi:murein DD-endopeptidase MepM/ murein hydrolase activator NlpD